LTACVYTFQVEFVILQILKCKMSKAELESFILKFHQLRRSGFTAHLDLDTHAGQAWVGLRVMLPNLQQQPQQQQQFHFARHRSPSYYRRQERRKAASVAAAESSELQEINNVNAEEAHNASLNCKSLIQSISSDKITEKVSLTEKAAFECDICDFVSNRQSGLNIHIARKHPTIEQLDGNTEEVIDTETWISKHWTKELEEHNEFIEMYLKTGEINADIRKDWKIIPCMEALLFVLSSESHFCKSLTSEQFGFEVLSALEVFRRCMDEVYVYGPSPS